MKIIKLLSVFMLSIMLAVTLIPSTAMISYAEDEGLQGTEIEEEGEGEPEDVEETPDEDIVEFNPVDYVGEDNPVAYCNKSYGAKLNAGTLAKAYQFTARTTDEYSFWMYATSTKQEDVELELTLFRKGSDGEYEIIEEGDCQYYSVELEKGTTVYAVLSLTEEYRGSTASVMFSINKYINSYKFIKNYNGDFDPIEIGTAKQFKLGLDEDQSEVKCFKVTPSETDSYSFVTSGGKSPVIDLFDKGSGNYRSVKNMYPGTKKDIKSTVKLDEGKTYYLVVYLQNTYEVIDPVDISLTINKTTETETGVDQNPDHSAIYLGGVELDEGITITDSDKDEYTASFVIGDETFYIAKDEVVYLGKREGEEHTTPGDEGNNLAFWVQGGSISKIVMSDGNVEYGSGRNDYMAGDSFQLGISGGNIGVIETSKATKFLSSWIQIYGGNVDKIVIGNSTSNDRGNNSMVSINDNRTMGEPISLELGYRGGKIIDSKVMMDALQFNYSLKIEITGESFRGLEKTAQFKDLPYCTINDMNLLTLHAMGGKFSNGSETIKGWFRSRNFDMAEDTEDSAIPEKPTKDGCIFKGWTLTNLDEYDSDGDEFVSVVSDNEMIDYVADIYACWIDEKSPMPMKVVITNDEDPYCINEAWCISDENIGNVFRGDIYGSIGENELNNYHVEITMWDSKKGDYVTNTYDFGEGEDLTPEYPLQNCWSMEFQSESKTGGNIETYIVRVFARIDIETVGFDLSYYNNDTALNKASYVSSEKADENGVIEVCIPSAANRVLAFASAGASYPEGGYGVRELKFEGDNDTIEKEFKFKNCENDSIYTYTLKLVRKDDSRITSLEDTLNGELESAPDATEDNSITIKIADPNQLSKYIDGYSRDGKRLSQIVDFNILLNNKFGLPPVKEYRIDNTSVYAYGEVNLFDKEGRDVWEIAEAENGGDDTEYAAVNEGEVYFAELGFSYWMEDINLDGAVRSNKLVPVKFEYVDIDSNLTESDLQQIAKGKKADYNQSIKYEDLAKVNLLANSGLVGTLPSMQEAGSMISAKNPDLYNELIGNSKFDIKLFSGLSGSGLDALGSSSQSVLICYFYNGVYYYALSNDEEETQLETSNTLYVDKTSANYGEAASARVNDYLSKSKADKKYEASFVALSGEELCEFLKDRMTVPSKAKAAYYTKHGISFYSDVTATDADSFIDTYEMWTYTSRKNAIKNGLIEPLKVEGNPVVLTYATDVDQNRLKSGKEAYQVYKMTLTSGSESLSDLYFIEGRDSNSPDLVIPTSSWTDRTEGIITEGTGIDIPIDTYHTAKELTASDEEYKKIDQENDADLSKADIYDLEAYSDISEKKVSDFGDGSMKVSVPVENTVTGASVAYFDDDGKMSNEEFAVGIETIGGQKYVSFTTNHFSTYGVFKQETKKSAYSVRVRTSTLPLKKKQSINAGANLTMTAGDKVASVSSSNGKVVKVSGATVKGLKKGKATVTVSLASGLRTAYVVKVQSSRVKAKISIGCPSKLTMRVGEKRAIGASKSPVSCTYPIKYKTSKKKVASVSGGTIYAKKAGSAKITVKCGSKKKTIKVKVI